MYQITRFEILERRDGSCFVIGSLRTETGQRTIFKFDKGRGFDRSLRICGSRVEPEIVSDLRKKLNQI